MHVVHGTWWRVAIVVCALAAAFVPLPATAVGDWYSAGAYASFQPLLTSFSNFASFSLLDILIGVVVIGWIALAARDARHSPSRFLAARRVLIRTLTCAAA